MRLNALFTTIFAIRNCIKVKINDNTTTNNPKYKTIFGKINNTLKPRSINNHTYNKRCSLPNKWGLNENQLFHTIHTQTTLAWLARNEHNEYYTHFMVIQLKIDFNKTSNGFVFWYFLSFLPPPIANTKRAKNIYLKFCSVIN